MTDDTRVLYEFVKLPSVLRKHERFFRYLELEKNDTEFRTTVNAGGFLNVFELYPLNGDITQLKHSNMRSKWTAKLNDHLRV